MTASCPCPRPWSPGSRPSVVCALVRDQGQQKLRSCSSPVERSPRRRCRSTAHWDVWPRSASWASPRQRVYHCPAPLAICTSATTTWAAPSPGRLGSRPRRPCATAVGLYSLGSAGVAPNVAPDQHPSGANLGPQTWCHRPPLRRRPPLSHWALRGCPIRWPHLHGVHSFRATWTSGGRLPRCLEPAAMHARSSSTDSPHKLFIIVREGLADVEARRARTICPPFIPTTGCRHLPVLTTLPVPTRPRRAQKTAARIFPSKAQALLGEAGLLRDIWEGITTQADYDIHHDCVDVDALLLAGWNRHAPARPTSPFEEPAKPSQESIALHQQETIHLVRRLWQLRAGLRMDARQASHADGAPTLSRLWQGWRTACQLQQLQTKLRKRGRLKKTHMVEMAVKADNIYQAARRFAPKTRKQRLQLRSAEGQLQTPEAEFTDIVQYFSELYGGALPTDPDVLEAPLDITWEEVAFAIHKLSPGKSMPSYSPPAALWKALRHQLAPVITKQLAIVFQPGVLLLPRAWCISELVLLPKPGKALTSASQLRPICLLPPTAKVLATSLATRLLPYAQEYLKQVPQFALHCWSLPTASPRTSLCSLFGGSISSGPTKWRPLCQKAGERTPSHCGRDPIIPGHLQGL